MLPLHLFPVVRVDLLHPLLNHRLFGLVGRESNPVVFACVLVAVETVPVSSHGDW